MSEPACAENKTGEVYITMLCKPKPRPFGGWLLYSVIPKGRGAGRREGVRQGQAPIMLHYRQARFSQKNGEIEASIFLATPPKAGETERLARPLTFLDYYAKNVKGCRTPEQLPQAFVLVLNG